MLALNQILHQRYRITAQLGQIDSGLGYSAFDNVLGVDVMLKETLCDDDRHPIAVPASVRHQSLLCAIDAFAESGRRYVVMDHIDGQTLGDLLEKRKSAFPVTDVGLWADGLLDALNQLHTHDPQIIHSDIKPHNIKLSAGGNVRLLLFDAGSAREQTTRAELTTFDSTVLGYLPIEQVWLGLDVGSRKVIRSGYDERSAEILELPLDVQSDLYAIGATLYHLLTARVPTDSLTRSIELLEGKADPLVPASVLNPSVPVEVSDILTRALQIKREERFGSASIMRQVLRSAFARAGSEAANAPEGYFSDDDAVLELPARKLPHRPAAPVIRPGMQSAESRQLEIIKRQLRDAEARRLEAEKRAAEAEQRLIERETEEFHLADIPIEIIEPTGPLPAPVGVEPVGEISSETIGEPEPVSFDTGGKGRRPSAMVAGAAAVLAVVCAAVWGVWSFSATTESTSATPTDPTVVAIPEPTEHSVETVLTTSTVPDPSPSTTEPIDLIETDQGVTPATRTRSTPIPPQQAKKQTSPTPKTAQPQKKSVTLDDLLKDN